MTEHVADRDYAARRDREDPLAELADRFYEPTDAYYMDGNSLGLLSEPAEEAVLNVLSEWRDLGIRGWTEGDPPWFYYGERLGDRLAPLVGARPDEVVVANSTTVNIHTLIGSFYDALEGTPTILANELDFPTDHYAIRAQLRQRGLDPETHFRTVPSEDGRTVDEDLVIEYLERDDDIGLLFFPSVFYHTGQLFDIERLTEAAHENDVLVGFDLAHSIGVVPHDLAASDVDFAVWCSYKYLNAGPGAVAGLYVNETHFGTRPALAGWWGHEKETQFEMRDRFTPAATAGAWQIGTIHMLSAAALDGAIDLVETAGVASLREKSLDLTGYLIYLIDEWLPECGVATPRVPERRGGHVAVTHEEAYRLSQALRDRGVVVDFRPPDMIRICPSPSYTGFRDVYDVVAELRDVLESGSYREYDPRAVGVT